MIFVLFHHPAVSALVLLVLLSLSLWGLLFVRLVMLNGGGIKTRDKVVRRGSLDGLSRAMVVVAHADDAELYCGGTVAALARRGVPVTLVVCSDGCKAYYQFGSRVVPNPLKRRGGRLVSVREEEQIRAAGLLGISEVVFLRYPDARLEERTLRPALADLMAGRHPDLVVTFDGQAPSHLEIRDHIAVGRAATDAARETSVPRLFCFSSRAPDVVVEISEVIALRWRALFLHRTQFRGVRGRLAVRILRSLARRDGARIGARYGESFREIVYQSA